MSDIDSNYFSLSNVASIVSITTANDEKDILFNDLSRSALISLLILIIEHFNEINDNLNENNKDESAISSKELGLNSDLVDYFLKILEKYDGMPGNNR